MVVDIYQEREGGTTSRKSGALGLVWTNGKQNTLASDATLALVVGLLVPTLAVVAIVMVMPLADHEVSPGIAAGVEAGFQTVGDLYNACKFRATPSVPSGLGEAMALAREENLYLDRRAPWFQIKEDRQAAATSVSVIPRVVDSLKMFLALLFRKMDKSVIEEEYARLEG